MHENIFLAGIFNELKISHCFYKNNANKTCIDVVIREMRMMMERRRMRMKKKKMASLFLMGICQKMKVVMIMKM